VIQSGWLEGAEGTMEAASEIGADLFEKSARLWENTLLYPGPNVKLQPDRCQWSIDANIGEVFFYNTFPACGADGTQVKDPARHEVSKLQEFCTTYGIP